MVHVKNAWADYRRVVVNDAGTLVVAGDRPRLLTSKDSGATWKVLENVEFLTDDLWLPESGNFVTLLGNLGCVVHQNLP
jgi:hypothetical protein